MFDSEKMKRFLTIANAALRQSRVSEVNRIQTTRCHPKTVEKSTLSIMGFWIPCSSHWLDRSLHNMLAAFTVSTQFRWWKITCSAMRTILRLNFITKMANAKRANCFNWQNITVFHPICSPNLFAIWWIIEMSFAQRKACPQFVSGNRTDKCHWFRENRKRIVRRK